MIIRNKAPGDTRERTFFTWLPLYYNGYTYWLETVKVTETIQNLWPGDLEWRIDTLEVIKK